MAADAFDLRATSLAALGEPVRRALYRFVVAQQRAVSRDEAAAGVGVPRHIAKFHLDRLEEDGLLEAEFRRAPGRSGPGAGRPAKLYRRAPVELAMSLPERRYDLAGAIMARAIARAEQDGIGIAEALSEAAAQTGRELGAAARARAGEPTSSESQFATARAVLDAYGYESREDAGGVALGNCPFHALAQDYTDLVCGMNLDFVQGLLEGLAADGVEGRLQPEPGRCCVTLCRAAR